MKRFKIAYIGAGSFRFSIGFFRNIINAKKLLPLEVALCDIDEKSLNIMEKILQKMVLKGAKRKRYSPDQIKITKSTDRKIILENADYVYKSISVGLQEAEFFDIYLPLKFGIPQNTGDTCGPGGIFRSLRTNLVSAQIAEDMHDLCPNATLLNYTNPQGTIVMAARTRAPTVQYIGICHEYIGGMAVLAAFLIRKKFRIPRLNLRNWWNLMDLEWGGINHFVWFTKFMNKGKDYYPTLRETAESLKKKKFLKHGFNFHLLKEYNFFPYPGSRHVAEFMPEYYNYFNYKVQSPYWKFPIVRNVIGLDRNRKRKYEIFRKIANGEEKVPGPVRFGELSVEMTLDWRNSIPRHYVVNIPNVHPNYNKIISELPDDCIVEVPAYFKDRKILPVKTIHLSKNITNLIQPHAEQQRLTVNASLGNSLENVVKAMRHDPMCKWIEDDDKLEYLTKLMLFYQRKWLPKDWQEWIPNEAELKQSKWWVSPDDLTTENNQYLKVMFPPDEKLKKKAYFEKFI